MTEEIFEMREIYNAYSGIFDSMCEQELALFKKLFNIIDVSMEVIDEQATVIQRIDEKLDKLLAKKD